MASAGKKRGVWFDICHVPQYNFYKNLILRLAEEGETVYVTLLERGKLPVIVEREIGNIENIQIDIVGKHKMNKFSAIWHANLIRIIQLFFWAFRKEISIGYSNGYQLAMICWMRRIPNYAFDDDPHTIDYYPKLWFSSGSHYCIFNEPDDMRISEKAKVLPVLKEWAYLNPNVFVPDKTVLSDYGLKPYSYIFVREVTVGTVNYAGQEAGSILKIATIIPEEMPVILSLEDKGKKELYPEHWILLQEPVKDIYSLIYYSRGLISSGDSMAREAALMGVASYYLGIRYNMPANKTAAKVANLNNREIMDFEKWLNGVLAKSGGIREKQSETINGIVGCFIDINNYMYSFYSNI